MAAGLPTSTLVEVELGGVFTDMTSFVSGGSDSLVIRQGRATSVDDSQPGTLTLTFDNADGRFNPDSPTIVDVVTGAVSVNPYFPLFVEDARIRVKVTKGSTVTRFLGWITDIQPNLADSPAQSATVVTATDMLGRLQRIGLRSQYEQAVLADAPALYWTLGDVQGSTSAQESSGNGGPVLTPYNFGQGPAVVFGSTGPGAGDGPTGATFGPAASGTGYGQILQTPRSTPAVTTVAAAGTFSLECWVKVNGGVGAYDVLTVMSADGLESLSIQCDLSATPAAVPLDVKVKTSIGATVISADSPAIGDGLWHHVVATYVASPFGCAFYLDGVQWDGALGLTPQSARLSTIRVGGGVPYYNILNGDVAHVAFYPTALSLAQVQAHYAAGNVNAAGSTVTAQVDRVLAYAGTFATSKETGFGPQGVGPVRAAGRAALDTLLSVTRGDSGVVYDNGGQLRFRAQSALRSSTVAATFDVEADLDGPPTQLRSTQGKVATVTSSSPCASVTVIDSTLQTLLGYASASIDSSLFSTVDLQSLATDRLTKGRNVATRISQVRVDLSTAQNNLYAAVWALQLGDRVRLSNLPSWLGVTYLDGYVQGWTEELAADRYTFTFDLEPADSPPEAVFDDATYGRFATNGTTTLNVGITASGTTVVLVTGGSDPTFTTSAGDYPLDINLNGERITLNSAPGGASSPQTFTGVTRGVAPTINRAHIAGEAVEVWDAAAFAL